MTKPFSRIFCFAAYFTNHVKLFQATGRFRLIELCPQDCLGISDSSVPHVFMRSLLPVSRPAKGSYIDGSANLLQNAFPPDSPAYYAKIKQLQMFKNQLSDCSFFFFFLKHFLGIKTLFAVDLFRSFIQHTLSL